MIEAQIEGTLYLTHTPNIGLRKSIQKIEDNLLKGKLSGRIRVVERLGPTIKDLLTNPTPWSKEHCGRDSCPPCQTKQGNCKKKNVLYTIDCLTCLSIGQKAQYHGETSRTLWDRSSEHWKGLQNKTDNNVLYKHWSEHHRELTEVTDFSVKIVRQCRTST